MVSPTVIGIGMPLDLLSHVDHPVPTNNQTQKEFNVAVDGITGKVAIITGAGRGIGREYARALAKAGASCVVAEWDEVNGAETAAIIEKEGGVALFVKTDVANEESVANMVASTVAQFGGVDILVNNAGIWGGLEFDSPEDISLELWNKVQSVNFTGSWLVARAVAPVMERRGGGTIINQSSVGAYLGGPALSHYCASKAAVNGLTRALAVDFGDANIRVNAIAPGIIETEATLSNVGDELLDSLEATQCLKRRGGTDDLIGPVLFFASDASSYITGQVLVVDGGGVKLG
ncbi:glucose 1-dehydrogenase [Mycobacterium sp. CVI_P3]|uniref:Glucose 1-dehydrogenase n=1 Tax=Mycobacterium pinniadriaticum TaxID=2994102 RepID=A0ABT3SMV6_9MYCO|nr:glucose 1-dehydrogenase [Mycobacterium pinniadriaticum]MCX2934421.1 glucose 1-dehydrogenase [Mycobacterium pinniadriaticum]MCX2940844.1 glucose 1-dehydrogenase [Mycobacterium pinniadriaticum]